MYETGRLEIPSVAWLDFVIGMLSMWARRRRMDPNLSEFRLTTLTGLAPFQSKGCSFVMFGKASIRVKVLIAKPPIHLETKWNNHSIHHRTDGEWERGKKKETMTHRETYIQFARTNGKHNLIGRPFTGLAVCNLVGACGSLPVILARRQPITSSGE